MDLKEQLTRKIGPLPVWAWGGVVGGGVLIAKAVTGGGGASSPFVTPIAQDGSGMNFGDPLASGGGGGAEAPWWTTLPGGQTIIDRPPGDVTILPPPSAPGTPNVPAPITRLRLSLTGRTPISDASGNIVRYLRSGTFDAIKVRINDRTYWKVTNSAGRVSYIHATSTPTYKIITPPAPTTGGDTSSTPGTPLAIVPSMPPMPRGNVLALPIFDGDAVYAGPTISAQPIASSARVVMPSLSSPRGGGSVAVPVVPAASGRPTWTRALDPLARAADRMTPDNIGTTARPVIRYHLPEGEVFVPLHRLRAIFKPIAPPPPPTG